MRPDWPNLLPYFSAYWHYWPIVSIDKNGKLNWIPLFINIFLFTNFESFEMHCKSISAKVVSLQFSPCWKEIIIFPLKGVVRWKGYFNPYRKSLHVLTNISDDKIRFIEIRLVGFIATNPIYKELVRWHQFLVRFSAVADINSIMKSSTAAFPSFLDTVCNKARISSRLFYISTL